MRNDNLVVLLCLAVLGTACTDNEITAPYAKNLELAVVDGDRQFALPGTMVPEPLRVRLEHYRTHEPVTGKPVSWRVVDSNGAVVTPESEMTDSRGLATARVRLGQDTGTYTIEATFPGRFGEPTRFTLVASQTPTIASIDPLQLEPGQVVTIRGDRFRAVPEDNAVYFDGLRAEVTSAATTEIRAIVPYCLTNRRVDVRVSLSLLQSEPIQVDVRTRTRTESALGVGEVARFLGPDAVSCVRLPVHPAGAQYLVIAQNASSAFQSPISFRLNGVTGEVAPPEVPAFSQRRPHPPTIADVWDAQLRRTENDLIARGATLPRRGMQLNRTTRSVPLIGDEREFAVPDTGQVTTDVSAVAQAVSSRAILYVDRNAPANGFSAADYERLVQMFDDVIYPTDVEVFGEPSDLDGNERVIILLSPAVNKLTPKGSNGYIAGFFNACDLVDDMQCAGILTEVFYAVVPDPEGIYGLAHKRETLARTLPSVLAHELQHMIHFNRRILQQGNQHEDELWLREALAHAAEDTVGGVFQSRGDPVLARQFREKNYLRAALYLEDPAAASIVDFQYSGTLEERGVAWLFLKYLTDRFGGDVLQRLTDGVELGADNVTHAVGTDWENLLSGFAVALYAGGLSERERQALAAQYRYRSFDLGAALALVGAGFPLQATALPFSDFVQSATLRSSSMTYTVLSGGSAAKALNLTVSARRGFALPRGTPIQLLVVRLR